ncbi:MAG: NUDIX hydrolase [Anaerolineae bacterium]
MSTVAIQKTAAYITRNERLLVFRHVVFPEAGLQVPGGTLAPGESPLSGALREAIEETGLSGLVQVAYLGSRTYTFGEGGAAQRIERHYVHLICTRDTPGRWLAWERDPSEGGPGPIAFEHFWVPLSAVPRLMPGMGDLLDAVGGREADSTGDPSPAI